MLARIMALGAGLAVLAILAACGGTSTASSTSAGGTATTPASGQSGSGGAGTVADACTLLSLAQAVQITGDSTVTQTPRANVPGESTCTYGGTGGGHVSVLALYFAAGVSQSALQRWITNEFQGSGGQPTGALKAVGSNEATLAFGKGTTLVVIDTQSMTRNGVSMESEVETLAKAAAGQL